MTLALMISCDASQPFQFFIIDMAPIQCTNQVGGSIDIEGVGGTTPYSFTLNGASPVTSTAITATFVVTPPNAVAKIIGIDNSSPKQKIFLNINSLVSSFTTIAINLTLRCNGTLIRYFAGSQAPQSVKLEGPNFTESQPFGIPGGFPSDPNAGLKTGHYKMTFTPQPTGNAACDTPVVFEFDITQSPLSIRAKNDPVCSTRDNTGSLTISAQGGVPNFTYTISGPSGNQFQGPTPNRKATFSDLANGVYTVTVSDSPAINKAERCTQTTQVLVDSRKCKQKGVFCAISC